MKPSHSSDLAVQLDHCALILHIFILSGTQSDKWLQATVASGKQIQQLLSYLPFEISPEVAAFLLERGSISIQEKKKKQHRRLLLFCFIRKRCVSHQLEGWALIAWLTHTHSRNLQQTHS